MSKSEEKARLRTSLFSGGEFDIADVKKKIQEEQQLSQKFIDELKGAYERGEDISDYVWPREWDFRKRPERHHASNIISLVEAIDFCGQYFHGSAWQEADWYARSPEDIKQWNPAYNFHRALHFTDKQKGADFTNRAEEEKQAFFRKQEVYGKLSSWLNEMEIEAFTLDSEGHKCLLYANIWLSREALKILDLGKIYEKDESGQPKLSGKSDFVYLNKEQLQKALNKERRPTNFQERKEIKPKNIICPEGVWSLEAMLRFSDKQKGEDGQSRKMGDIAHSFIHFLLVTPALEVFTINSYTGDKTPIDRDSLRSKRAIAHFIKGLIPFDSFRASEEDGEYIFVNRTQFENYLTDKGIQDDPSQDKRDQGQDSYVPAYLEFMLQAVKALNLTSDKRANIDEIIDWLNKNWPSDLEGKSDILIKYMATLIRRPEDKKGGNTSWNKKK